MIASNATSTTLSFDYLTLLSVTLIAIGLSLFIVFQAYRGYRHHESRRMLFLALGLFLLTVVPFSLAVVVDSLAQMATLEPRVTSYYLPLFSRLSEVSGLGCLLYSLLIDAE
ncbi:hypothetical protein JCM18750_19540 [Halostagnicola bangensis]